MSHTEFLGYSKESRGPTHQVQLNKPPFLLVLNSSLHQWKLMVRKIAHLKHFRRSFSPARHRWKLTEKLRMFGSCMHWFVIIIMLANTNFYTPISPSQRCDIDILSGNAWEYITQETNKMWSQGLHWRSFIVFIIIPLLIFLLIRLRLQDQCVLYKRKKWKVNNQNVVLQETIPVLCCSFQPKSKRHWSSILLSTGPEIDGVQLPDSDDNNLLVGCRKSIKFYNWTAGVMALVRPCSIIANITVDVSRQLKHTSTFGRSLLDLERLDHVFCILISII